MLHKTNKNMSQIINSKSNINYDNHTHFFVCRFMIMEKPHVRYGSKHYFHTSYSHIWIQKTQIKYWWSSNCVNKNNFNVILCSNDNKFTWHWNVTCCCRRNTFCIYLKTNADWSYVLIIRTICWVSRYIICLNDSTTVYWKLVCYM